MSAVLAYIRHHASRWSLALAALAAALSSFCLAAPAGAATFSNGTSIVVENTSGENSPNAYPSSIAAYGLAGPAVNVRVTLHSFTHTEPSGVDILLVAPNGQNVVLMSDVCDALNGVTLTFDDAAAGPIASPCMPGTYKPFDGAATDAEFSDAIAGPYGTTLAPLGSGPNGTWNLYVSNNENGGPTGGSISGGWSLELLDPIQFEPPSPTPLVPRFCDGKHATIVGTEGSDIIVGTPGADVITGLGGIDGIRGGLGRDVICGGDRGDKLRGEGGKDRLFGGAYNDRLAGGSGKDRLDGGSGGADYCVDGGSAGGPLDEGRTIFLSCERP